MIETYYVVQVDVARKVDDDPIWTDYGIRYRTSPEADVQYEDLVRQYSHRKVRIIERKIVETSVRRNYL